MITIQITSASKVGCVRSQNEDMILVGNHFVRNDGFVASSDALHNLQFFFHDLPTGLNPNGINEMLIGWLDSINNVIASKGRSDEQYKGMGTTLVGIAFYEGEFYSMNCGDSRLYRFRNGELTQLTTDHSLSNMLGSSHHSNIIMDIVKMTEDVKIGDVYMLCSDGLTDMLPDHVITTLLTNGCDANNLCDAAVEAGGLDNVSCCVLKF